MADKLPQHPFVESVKSAPSEPAKKIVILTGLPGDSDQPDLQRLYLTAKLNYYAEFPVSAILSAETVPADQSPIAGQEATQVSISRDATIRYVTETSSQPIDEFDLDVRLGASGAATAAPALGTIIDAICLTPGCTNACTATCLGHATCHAGATCAGHGTCVATQCVAGPNDVHNTCVYTNNHGNTCVTCAPFTACNQATCANTQCQQATCRTCAQVHTCALTCVG